jgi:WD repeat-containing protein 48
VNTAHADYEERELAADAVPLYTVPDDVIPGDHGLVRSIILNDRIHALTVDTSGEVAVWDMVRGICCGRFLREDVAAASHRGSSTGGSSGGEKERSPREALETVRELIEGEAAVGSWCTADTKTGLLAIHMNERCFEGEIYADEVGFAHDRHFNDESKCLFSLSLLCWRGVTHLLYS